MRLRSAARKGRWARGAAGVGLAVVVFTALGSSTAARVASAVAVPPPPAGLSAISLDGSVGLAWQPVSGATGYVVYRGLTPTTVTTAITPAGGTSAVSFSDAGAVNGTSYYYAVTALGTSGESQPSSEAGATPQARSCSTGNAIAVENCFPGTSAWKLTSPGQPPTGIEGYATSTSVNAGQSVDLKVNTAAGAPYHIEIYRTGYYGGSEARLISVLPGLTGVSQDACQKDFDTGLVDCSSWSVTSTISTTSAWPTGVYLLRLVREDNGTDYHILLVVRHDGSSSDIFYAAPVTTYEAYNNWGGRSLYAYNSSGGNTVAGTPQAVKVSFDRPFNQPLNGDRNWYTKSDLQNVSWLEQQGYDTSYGTSLDLQTNGGQLLAHKVYISPSHDEYWSQQMRDAVTSARDAGVSLTYLGSNADYWKIRFEASPFSGASNRVEVSYKSIATGAPDPSGIPTTTWRDPVVGQPENGLVGQMYIGDNDSVFFPLVVSAAQAQNRVWRYTTLTTLAPGTSASVGQNLVGWEWDARVSNGAEPAGIATVAGSPVNGELLQDAGKVLANGNATTNATEYRAASGAWVFATGTNHWSRGLGLNMDGVGEPNAIIKQATVNVLADGGAAPTTPSAGVSFDQSGPASVTGTSPASGATAVSVSTKVTATFDRPVDPSTVTPQSFTLKDSNGNLVPATVAFDQPTLTATLTPSSPLLSGVVYTARLGTGITTWTGTPLSAPVSFSFTTSTVVTVTQTSPANGATSVSPTASVSATFSSAVDPATVTGQTFTLTDSGGNAVPATVTYDGPSRTATLTPSAALQAGATYTAALTSGVHAADGTPLASPPSWSFITTPPPAVCPCSLFPSSATPATLHTSTRDNRTGTGPWSYELGTKIQVTVPAQLTAIRFYKDSQETGTHIGRVWTSTGTLLAQATFTNETASGWQQAALPLLVTLQPGQTYVVSVGLNAFFASTQNGLLSQITQGPLKSVADGKNGVFGSAAGVFPNQSFKSTNYFVDAVVYEQTGAPSVTRTSPTDGTTGVSWTPTLSASFDRPLDPGSVNAQTFRLADANGTAVPATVAYDGSAFVATLTPTQPLQAGMTYTARLTSGIATWAGTSLSPAVSFGFTTSGFAVSQTSPVDGATGVAANAAVSVSFSGAVDPATLTSQSFTLQDSGGSAVAGTIAYNSGSKTATLTPSSPLRFGTNYTVTLTTAVRTPGGTGLPQPFIFGFRTKELVVSQLSPASGATNVGSMATVSATFSSAVDPTTLTSQTFSLVDSGGNVVPGTIAYNSSTQSATLTPSTPLPSGASFTVTLTSAIRGTDGSTLASPPSWSFTTASCSCSLFAAGATPTVLHAPTRDGRSGTGPWSYELGVKIQVTSPVQLTAIRFYKDSSETGSHVGTVWSSSGAVLARTTFSGETASGWQQQTLTAPLTLQPGQVYIVSVGFNAFFSYTSSGLLNQITSGPLQSVADGRNGVYGSAAGVFPNQSFRSTNYFVDAVVG